MLLLPRWMRIHTTINTGHHGLANDMTPVYYYERPHAIVSPHLEEHPN